jgi:hypothetical protein
MGRTVADAAELLSIAAERDVAGSLDAGVLPGARIGVARNLAGFHERVEPVFE